ncbi:unnamed protein product, partial [Sphacelaria rigidula]
SQLAARFGPLAPASVSSSSFVGSRGDCVDHGRCCGTTSGSTAMTCLSAAMAPPGRRPFQLPHSASISNKSTTTPTRLLAKGYGDWGDYMTDDRNNGNSYRDGDRGQQRRSVSGGRGDGDRYPSRGGGGD